MIFLLHSFIHSFILSLFLFISACLSSVILHIDFLHSGGQHSRRGHYSLIVIT